MYYPNYGTRLPHNGREVRAAVTQLDATALSSLPLLQIDSLQIVWYSNEEHGHVYEACSKEETKTQYHFAIII